MEDLTLEKILDKVNNENRSGIFLTEKNFSDYLSGIWYDEAGKIAGAKATIIRLFNKLNSTEAMLNPGNSRDWQVP
jgi:hypothetical protein